MATLVEVDVSVQAEIVKAQVDGTAVRLSNGTGTVKVPSGNHALTWTVRGASGTQYTIKITSPKEAAFSHSDTFDDDQFDAGLKWFVVNATE